MINHGITVWYIRFWDKAMMGYQPTTGCSPKYGPPWSRTMACSSFVIDPILLRDWVSAEVRTQKSLECLVLSRSSAGTQPGSAAWEMLSWMSAMIPSLAKSGSIFNRFLWWWGNPSVLDLVYFWVSNHVFSFQMHWMLLCIRLLSIIVGTPSTMYQNHSIYKYTYIFFPSGLVG